MESIFRTRSLLIFNKSRQQFFMLIFIYIISFTGDSYLNPKFEQTMFVIKSVLYIGIFICYVCLIIVSFHVIKIEDTHLTYYRGISILRISRIIFFQDIISYKFINTGKNMLAPFFKSKKSKGTISLVYPGKSKYSKKTLLIDLDLFEDSEELKNKLSVINDKYLVKEQ